MKVKETKYISNHILGIELKKRGYKLLLGNMDDRIHWQCGDIEILYERDVIKLHLDFIFLILDYQNGRFYSASSNSEALEILTDISRGDL